MHGALRSPFPPDSASEFENVVHTPHRRSSLNGCVFAALHLRCASYAMSASFCLIGPPSRLSDSGCLYRARAVICPISSTSMAQIPWAYVSTARSRSGVDGRCGEVGISLVLLSSIFIFCWVAVFRNGGSSVWLFPGCASDSRRGRYHVVRIAQCGGVLRVRHGHGSPGVLFVVWVGAACLHGGRSAQSMAGDDGLKVDWAMHAWSERWRA
ncbi:hypothetical protein C8R45DRAFT_1002265 [Mycena sanguinolenta]|nr:hypothetical protein C8R45DRAFT_1002265 [Mycena sanguinolenta]